PGRARPGEQRRVRGAARIPGRWHDPFAARSGRGPCSARALPTLRRLRPAARQLGAHRRLLADLVHRRGGPLLAAGARRAPTRARAAGCAPSTRVDAHEGADPPARTLLAYAASERQTPTRSRSTIINCTRRCDRTRGRDRARFAPIRLASTPTACR